MADRLPGLWPHAVVCRDDNDGHIGHPGAPRPHGTEGFVAGGVEETDGLVLAINLEEGWGGAGREKEAGRCRDEDGEAGVEVGGVEEADSLILILPVNLVEGGGGWTLADAAPSPPPPLTVTVVLYAPILCVMLPPIPPLPPPLTVTVVLYAPMLCVMPPASPAATRDLRMKSSRLVLPGRGKGGGEEGLKGLSQQAGIA